MSDVELHIIGTEGQLVGKVVLEPPLRLGVGDAFDLLQKLAGIPTPAASLLALTAAPTPVSDDEAERPDPEAEQRRNLRSRAESYDLDGLYAWLRTLDPANPHMAVAHEVVSERIAELQERQPAAPAGPPSPAMTALIAEARELDERYRADIALAEQGDDAARVRAQETRSRIVQIQQDIADGVDRREETGS